MKSSLWHFINLKCFKILCVHCRLLDIIYYRLYAQQNSSTSAIQIKLI